MILKTRHWGPACPDSIVCVHGLAQHGGLFEELGRRLTADGHSVIAVDLRGHGDSGREPPWNTETHVEDLLATLDSLAIERATWVGHSFGGRLSAAVAVEAGERTQRLVLLDPALELPAAAALRGAEIDRLDWSFATADGAVNALLSSESMVAPPRDVVAAYARDNLRKGPDGRLRFRFCPSAAVVAWNEISRPAPPIAHLPTLVIRAAVPWFDLSAQESRYRETLGDLMTSVTVPGGHHLLWESPAETIDVVGRFLGPASHS